MDPGGRSIVGHSSVAGYFKEQWDKVCGQRHLAMTDQAGSYVVKLLADFASAENLFLPAEDARTRELVPLAELLGRAAAADPDDRVRILKHLGDSSLYVGGFFQDALERHNVDVRYYVAMGGGAYGQLAALRGGPVFGELGRRFPDVVRALRDIADEHRGLADPTGHVLELYERWLHTGSARARASLLRRGVDPGRGPRH